jgi:hypothetical protein
MSMVREQEKCVPSTNMSRRKMFGALPVAAAVTAGFAPSLRAFASPAVSIGRGSAIALDPISTSAMHPDAELLAMEAELSSIMQKEGEIYNRWSDAWINDDPRLEEFEVERDAAFETSAAAIAKIADWSPKTIDGLKLKARLAQNEAYEAIAQSLPLDILAL